MIFKLLIPIIWLINLLNYFSHLESYRHSKYEPYDFNKDITVLDIKNFFTNHKKDINI